MTWIATFVVGLGGAGVGGVADTLPAVTFREAEPQKYRFTCDYVQTDERDAVLGRQRIAATYVRGLPEGKVEWSEATFAEADDLEGPLEEPARELDYLSEFAYDGRQTFAMFFPSFFEAFPNTTRAMYAKNLIWDTHMLEQFGRGYFSELELNEPFVLTKGSGGGVPLAGMGAFKNRRIELTWLGQSEQNGEPCALIRYEAFFNTFQMVGIGEGLSHYWGLIWVSLEDKQIERATLREQVSLRIQRGEGEARSVDVFRSGVLEKQ